MTRRLLAGFGLLCLYAVVAAWWLRPVTWHAAHELPGPRGASLPDRVVLGDLYLTLWVLTAGAQQLGTAPLEVFHPPAFYPERYALAFSEHLLGHQPLFAPVFAASGNPVLALNLSLLASTVLLGVGTHLLVRRWGGGPAAAVLAAALAIAAPWRVGAGVARAHTLWTHYLPFILLFLDRYVTARSRTALALAASCLGLQMLSSYYAGYAAAIMVAVYLLANVRRAPAAVARAGLGLGVALGLAAAVSYPYLALARAGVVHPVSEDFVSRVLAVWGTPAVLTRGMVGIAPVAGTALLLLVRPWRRGDATAPYGTLIAIAAAGYVLALGPILHVPRSPGGALRAVWDILAGADPNARSAELLFRMRDAHAVPLPYALLAAVVPGFAQLRATSRFGVLPATVLPVTAALALAELGRRVSSLPWLLALAAVVVVFRMPPTIPVRVEVGADVPPAYQWLRAHGEHRPLLEAPVNEGLASVGGILRDARAMYFATYHRLPLLNGYAGYTPDTFTRRFALAATLPEPQALAALCAETRLGWILLHRDELPAAARARWADLPPGLRLAASFGDDALLAVDCAPRDVRAGG